MNNERVAVQTNEPTGVELVHTIVVLGLAPTVRLT
jgi:hypothetical protein